MPPSQNRILNALNFKKALDQSPNMIALRLRMRDQFRRRLRYLTIQDLDDPNRKYPDPNEGDKEFRKLRKKLIYNLEI